MGVILPIWAYHFLGGLEGSCSRLWWVLIDEEYLVIFMDSLGRLELLAVGLITRVLIMWLAPAIIKRIEFLQEDHDWLAQEIVVIRLAK